MSDSFFRARKDSVLAAASDNFSTRLSASPSDYRISVLQASQYADLNAAFQSAYQTAITPSTRTKSSVAAKNAARIPLRKMASDLAKIIAGTPAISAQQKIDLGLSVPATPKPRPAPGTPNRFNVTLASNGALTLTWKCDNPRGSVGTMYQVWRRIGPAGQLEYLGGSGERKFVDNTVPAGSAQVVYQVQAVRSKSVGEWAQYNVNLGVSGGSSGPVIDAQATPAPRIAA